MVGPQLLVAVLVDGATEAHAGVVDQDVDGPERLASRGDGRVGGRRVRQVDVDGRDPTAVAGDVVGDDGQRVGRAVEHRHRGALVGEEVGRGAAHAAGGAGDHGHLAFDRAAELGEARHGP